MKTAFPIAGTLIFYALISFCSCPEKGRNLDVLEPGDHPCLILTKNSVPDVTKGLGNLLLLQLSFEEIKAGADTALEKGITVPVPKDPGGGYTHEQHKQNALDLYQAGICYQLTGMEKYALFVKEMLLQYAAMYPALGIHPAHKDQSPGKLFWQGLNESVWLVYAIQAYDCIYEFTAVEERLMIENNLFRKIVEFFTVDDPGSINRIHNHGTWACAGVGMTGIVLGDPDYVDIALYGTDKSGKAGFLKQLDELISPDGLYAEGPYYQRYAIMPMMLFAKALDNHRKDLKIFEFKDHVLDKSVTALLQLTDNDGRFYPLNDAMKDKDIRSPEVIIATDISYANTGNPELLGIAGKQGRVILSGDGLAVAEAIQAKMAKVFEFKSVILSDGGDGKQGGIAILRKTFDHGPVSVVLKAGTQGMGHGHFDRLSYILYENGNEIIQDYGAARFLNIEEKQGGRYLPENKSWAKQTIAHNTVALQGESHFKGNLEMASRFHADILYSDLTSEDILLVAATDSHCYNNAVLQRTLALIQYNHSPVIIDLFRILHQERSTLDLPVYFQGQLISTNFKPETFTEHQEAMGTSNGYQHLWKVALSREPQAVNSLTWLNDNRFYTLSFPAGKNCEVFLTRIGANDPDFNLRNEPGMLIRQHDARNHSFVTAIEAHGNADPVKETVAGSGSGIGTVSLVYQDDAVSVIHIESRDGSKAELCLSHFPDANAVHEIDVNGVTVGWTGNYAFKPFK